jgi:hypothetical protein
MRAILSVCQVGILSEAFRGGHRETGVTDNIPSQTAA